MNTTTATHRHKGKFKTDAIGMYERMIKFRLRWFCICAHIHTYTTERHIVSHTHTHTVYMFNVIYFILNLGEIDGKKPIWNIFSEWIFEGM